MQASKKARSNQDLIDRLVVKFSVINENVGNVKEAIGSGTLADALREAKQLAYSANSLVEFLNELQKQQKPTMGQASLASIVESRCGLKPVNR